MSRSARFRSAAELIAAWHRRRGATVTRGNVELLALSFGGDPSGAYGRRVWAILRRDRQRTRRQRQRHQYRLRRKGKW